MLSRCRSTHHARNHPFLMLLTLAVSILGFTGCQPGKAVMRPPSFIMKTDQPASYASAAPAEKRVALVMKTLTNPFFLEMEKGARQAEKEFGVHLIVKTAAQETSIEQQIEIVESLIKEKVDAIIIAPGDSVGLVPVLKRAQDAGIIIINIDNRLDPQTSKEKGLRNVPFISVNNEQGAYLSAHYISSQVDVPTRAVILEGMRTARNGVDRKNGALRAFQENPNITVVAVETAHWKIDEGYDVTRSLFSRYPDIGLIFCANDMMALGAVQFLEETGRSDVLVAAYDALEEAKQAIRDGKAGRHDRSASCQARLYGGYVRRGCL